MIPLTSESMPKPEHFGHHARLFMGTVLVMVDIITILLSAWIAIQIASDFTRLSLARIIEWAFPCISAIILIYFLMGLYSPGNGPVLELRMVFISTSIVFLFFLALFLWFGILDLPYTGFLVSMWLLTLFLVPSMRAITRKILAGRHCWGEPVVVIGFGPLGYKLVSYLSKNPMIGFIPRLVIDRRKSERQDTRPIPGNVIVKKISEIEAEGQKSLGDIRTAILVTSETPGDFYETITEISHLTFSRLIVVSAMEQQSNLWLQPYDLGGIIGLEIGQNLIDTYQQAIKRIIDVFLILAFLPVTLPLTAVVALLVALN